MKIGSERGRKTGRQEGRKIRGQEDGKRGRERGRKGARERGAAQRWSVGHQSPSSSPDIAHLSSVGFDAQQLHVHLVVLILALLGRHVRLKCLLLVLRGEWCGWRE